MKQSRWLGLELLEMTQERRPKDTKSGFQSPTCQKANQIRRLNLGGIKLSKDQTQILAGLFTKIIAGDMRIQALPFLSETFGGYDRGLQKCQPLLDLIEVGIVSCDAKSWSHRGCLTHSRDQYLLDPLTLVECLIGLPDTVLSYLMGNGTRALRPSPKPFTSNAQFLESWYEYLDVLWIDNKSTESTQRDSWLCGQSVDHRKALDRRLAVTKHKFPFQRLAARYKLTEEEQLIILYLMKDTQHRGGSTEDELKTLVAHITGNSLRTPAALSPRGALLREGLILRCDTGGFIFDRRDFEIAPEVASEIIDERKPNDDLIIDSILKSDSVLSPLTPRHGLEKLVLPHQQVAVVTSALAQYHNRSRRSLVDWGIEEGGQPIDHRNGRLLILLYGPPGTGKTALAHAIARQLNRMIVATDVARILGKYVGDSEKNLSLVFSTFRRIVRRTSAPPVLLFNEADQLLANRIAASSSPDRMYNQMQNILLEQLEQFNGVLIATTNLVSNLDQAFSRRFDLKLELKMPDVDLREKLWETLLPKRLPLKPDVDLQELSRRFNFSGAQIETAIRNAAVAAASRVGKRKKVCHADLLLYCQLEQQGSFDQTTVGRIGFRS